MSMKNPLTPAGIEPAIFRFLAQHRNHCAIYNIYYIYIYVCVCKGKSTVQPRTDHEGLEGE